MRTTVTLDPDVERLIRDAMRERAISFKEALNEAARAGLGGKGSRHAKKFTQRTFRLGHASDFIWDKALALGLAGLSSSHDTARTVPKPAFDENCV